MQIARFIGPGLIVVGVVLLILGWQASESTSSELSEAFHGAPSDKTIWLLVGGGILTVLGVVKTMRGRSKGA